ncbi:efflux RND transporter permease subunit [Sutterella sp.]|uniref:efflux RND transporter permease subunit n=1 Tax=Sutterella sp. TaxID=1981025 RepID=UPI0026E0B709|nr:efflux RND transporter permease subunit [Sutterella sp.]MDO5530466.1 efflux RND transporter permease subunit [Sutterella sp.]
MFSRFFIDRPVFSWVIAIVIMLAGILSIETLPVSQYPQIAPPQVSITATYPGASASTIENTVTQVIEQNITGLDGYLYMNSTSDSAGRMSITVTFEAGTDPDMAQVQVQNKIQTALSSLPNVVQQLGVTIQKTSANFLMVVGFISKDGSLNSADLGDFLVANVEEPLGRVSGVGEVQVFGSSYAMRVWLDPDKLDKYGLVPSDITAAITAQNAQVSTGSLAGQPTDGKQEFTATISSSSLLATPEEFRNILLKVTDAGANVYLRDVAEVGLGPQSYTAFGTYKGMPSSGIAVKLASGSNALATQAAVLERIEELRPLFPESVEAVVPFDTTPFVRAALHEVVKTLVEAIFLVVVVMYLFLQNWRATIIPTIAVPVVLLGTFAMLAATGSSINMLSMFAMVLAIGLLVDDAIVVVENVERVMREDGSNAHDATVKSMGQITGALVGIAMVLSAVFIPMAFFGGSTGVIYRQFSITIVSAMVLSVVVALTLTPSLCAKILKPISHEHHMGKGGFFGWFNRGFEIFTGASRDFVGLFVRHPLLTFVAYAAVIGGMLLGFMKLPTGFMPAEDQGVALLTMQLPQGATMERTDREVKRVQAYLEKTEDANLDSFFCVRGFSFAGSGQNMALGFLKLKDWEERPNADQSVAAIQGRAMGAFMMSPEFKNASTFVFPLPSVPELGVADGFDFFIQDQKGQGHAKLMEVRNAFLAAANQDPRLTMVRHNGMDDTAQMELNLDYEKLSALSLDISSVNSTISTAFAGTYVNDFLDRARIKQVWVQGNQPSRMQPEDLMNWKVRNTNGEMVPIGAFATTSWDYGSPNLERFNGLPSVNIQGSPAAGVSSGDAMNAVLEIAERVFPPGYSISWNGVSYQERQAGEQEGALYAISILVVFLCLAALYESWSVPIAVLLVIPCGIVGAFGLTWLLDMNNDVYFKVGMLTTMGLVSKNAILIVEFAKALYDNGEDIVRAALHAVEMRLRPILMTSLAFGLGVLPLTVAHGAGSGAQNAIGVGVLGGMITGTVLCVMFVPAFFVYITKIASFFSGGPKKGPTPPAPEPEAEPKAETQPVVEEKPVTA